MTDKPAPEPADQEQSGSGNIQFGSGATVHGDVVGRDQRKIDTGGGNYYEGGTAGGGITQEEVEALFTAWAQRVEASPAVAPQVKTVVKEQLDEVKAEVVKGEKTDEKTLDRRLRTLAVMAPDIFEVAVDTFINPAKGFATIIRKVAERARQASSGTAAGKGSAPGPGTTG
jgi:hypothetical protein